VCYFGALCSFGEWDTVRDDFSHSGNPTRRSHFSIFILDLCRGFEFVTSKGEGEIEGSPPLGGVLAHLNHLFFADDSLLFCIADLCWWNKLSTLLNKYETAFGQQLNTAKTTIYFSRNTPQETQQKIT
jgi:hypothetical protein